MDYILIDISNQYGLDKENWEPRLAWANDLVNLKADDIDRAIFEADEPILMRKALRAYKSAMNRKTTGFMVGLDATASGLQILSALMGCHTTAREVNLINTGTREDCYTKVAYIMNSKYGCNVTRIICKKPVMTYMYGSEAQPKAVFGDGTPTYHAFISTLTDLFPGAIDARNIIQSCWNPKALFHQFTLPDGHVAKIKVIHAVEKKIEIAELGKATFTHRSDINMSSQEAKLMELRGKYVEPNNALSLAANVTHSVDAYIVREMIRRSYEQGFQLLHIHDSFS